MMNIKELIEAVKNERGSAFQNCNDCEYGIHNCEVIEKLNRLAELEDKIEQGLMIELPCKVGDTVYVIDTDWDEDCNDFYYLEEREFMFYLLDYWGKTVFLTREEAEARLKELQNG